jgi:hypothetical protein
MQGETDLAARAVRPVLREQFDWFYAAVEPVTADESWLDMPRLDHLCFGRFCESSRERMQRVSTWLCWTAPRRTRDAAMQQRGATTCCPPVQT